MQKSNSFKDLQENLGQAPGFHNLHHGTLCYQLIKLQINTFHKQSDKELVIKSKLKQMPIQRVSFLNKIKGNQDSKYVSVQKLKILQDVQIHEDSGQTIQQKSQSLLQQKSYGMRLQFFLRKDRILSQVLDISTKQNPGHINLFDLYLLNQKNAYKMQCNIKLVNEHPFDLENVSYQEEIEATWLKLSQNFQQSKHNQENEMSHENPKSFTKLKVSVKSIYANGKPNSMKTHMQQTCYKIKIWSSEPIPQINSFYIQNDDQVLLMINNNKQLKTRQQFQFEIENFQCYLVPHQFSLSVDRQLEEYSTSQLKNDQGSYLQLPIHRHYSYPLSLDISKMSFKLDINRISYIQSLINKQLPYSSPNILNRAQKQLYICHDMKGGYKQDIHPFKASVQKSRQIGQHQPFQNLRPHSYRFYHLDRTCIFNYFSHYPITIPPKSWRILCKKYRVACLGTFIVEDNPLSISQDEYLTEQFALKLVYLAKHIQFDGYLINIQKQISSVNKCKKLLQWVSYLTQRINSQILNSQIIWYDSIVLESGKIQYQNSLNSKNLKFYLACNGIFTNYWWQQPHLRQSIQLKVAKKPVYIGNDCFGRGTFGGGKFDLYKACNKIADISKTLNQKLSIALFAPGFTYENENGQVSRSNFNLNQKRMYQGVESRSQDISLPSKWKILQNGGSGWQYEGEWSVCSHQLCSRQLSVSLKQFMSDDGQGESIIQCQSSQQLLQIKFSCVVKGTGPKFDDPFDVQMKIFNKEFNMSFVEEKYSLAKVTSENQLQVQLSLQIDCGILSEHTFLVVRESGQDAEKWAGSYGARFKNQQVTIMKYSKKKNWLAVNSEIQPVQIILFQNLDRFRSQIQEQVLTLDMMAFQTFFNTGSGKYFFWKGSRLQKNYDQLSAMDLFHVVSLNNPLYLQLCYEHAYIGASSIRISPNLLNCTSNSELKMLVIKFCNENCQIADKYQFNQSLIEFRIVSKNIFPTQLKMSNFLPYDSSDKNKQADNFILPFSESKNPQQVCSNGWKSYTAIIQTQKLQNIYLKDQLITLKFQKQQKEKASMSHKQDYLIGLFSIREVSRFQKKLKIQTLQSEISEIKQRQHLSLQKITLTEFSFSISSTEQSYYWKINSANKQNLFYEIDITLQFSASKFSSNFLQAIVVINGSYGSIITLEQQCSSIKQQDKKGQLQCTYWIGYIKDAHVTVSNDYLQEMTQKQPKTGIHIQIFDKSEKPIFEYSLKENQVINFIRNKKFTLNTNNQS